MNGSCVCVYELEGVWCQLKPCRFSVELFARGAVDIDVQFILQGVVFGFKIVDDNCNVAYDCGRLHKGDTWSNRVIEDKLNSELASGILIRLVIHRPVCMGSL